MAEKDRESRGHRRAADRGRDAASRRCDGGAELRDDPALEGAAVEEARGGADVDLVHDLAVEVEAGDVGEEEESLAAGPLNVNADEAAAASGATTGTRPAASADTTGSGHDGTGSPTSPSAGTGVAASPISSPNSGTARP